MFRHPLVFILAHVPTQENTETLNAIYRTNKNELRIHSVLIIFQRMLYLWITVGFVVSDV